MNGPPPQGTATEANGWTIYGPPVRGRTCGDCKLCCTLLPVQLDEGHKPSNVRCQHLTSRGCGIYDHRPQPCQYWSCKWLIDDTTAGLRRPDHSGYAIDPMLDTILADGNPIEVIQVWCDPKRRDAHRDPALRAWLAEMAKRYRLPAIIRWGSSEGMVVAAPALTESGEWQEHGGELHGSEAMRVKLAEVGAVSILDSIVPRRRTAS